MKRNNVVQGEKADNDWKVITGINWNKKSKKYSPEKCPEWISFLEEEIFPNGVNDDVYFEEVRNYMIDNGYDCPLGDGHSICSAFTIGDLLISTKEDFYRQVTEDYHRHDTELNSLYFDFNVRMKEKDIIKMYCECQADINDDTVTRGDDIRYDQPGFIKEGEYEDIYEGSAMKFLESFNDKGIFKRWNEDEEMDFIL